jgi:superfamily II DNA or RNA helicase
MEYERQPSVERPLDVNRASILLDYPIAVVDKAPGEYDERTAIAARALKAERDIKEWMARAAQAIGQEVDPSQLEALPDPVTLDHLRRSLARERKRLGMIDGLLLFEKDMESEAILRGTPLRSDQHTAVHDFREFILDKPPTWEAGGKSGAIIRATGTGKTGILAKLTAAFKHNEREDEPVRVLILTPTRKIRDQTMGEDGRRGLSQFAPDIEGTRYPLQERNDPDEEEDQIKGLGDVTVMCNASFDTLLKKGKLPDYDVVIVDEAHMVGEVTEGNLRAYCADKLLVGLTATPERMRRGKVTKNIWGLFERRIHTLDVRESIQSGILAPVRAREIVAEPDWETIMLPEDPTERRQEKRRLRLEVWKKVMEEEIRIAIKRRVGTLVRCPPGDDISFARNYAIYLRSAPPVIMPNTGQAPDTWKNYPHYIRAKEIGGKDASKVKERELQQTALKMLEQGEFDVLTYVDALGVGYDGPAKVHGDLRPSESSAPVAQSVGRILRLMLDAHGRAVLDSDGKPIRAEAITFIDPDMPHQYTCCNALNLRSGEVIDYIPPPKHRVRKPAETPLTQLPDKPGGDTATTLTAKEPLVLKYTTVVAGEQILTHTERPRWPLSFVQAAGWLSIGRKTLRTLLPRLGFDQPESMTYGEHELDTIMAYHPSLGAEPLPARGYTSLDDLAELAPYPIKPRALRTIARKQGLAIHRLITSQDEGVNLYLADDDANQLLRALDEPATS